MWIFEILLDDVNNMFSALDWSSFMKQTKTNSNNANYFPGTERTLAVYALWVEL